MIWHRSIEEPQGASSHVQPQPYYDSSNLTFDMSTFSENLPLAQTSNVGDGSGFGSAPTGHSSSYPTYFPPPQSEWYTQPHTGTGYYGNAFQNQPLATPSYGEAGMGTNLGPSTDARFHAYPSDASSPHEVHSGSASRGNQPDKHEIFYPPEDSYTYAAYYPQSDKLAMDKLNSSYFLSLKRGKWDKPRKTERLKKYDMLAKKFLSDHRIQEGTHLRELIEKKLKDGIDHKFIEDMQNVANLIRHAQAPSAHEKITCENAADWICDKMITSLYSSYFRALFMIDRAKVASRKGNLNDTKLFGYAAAELAEQRGLSKGHQGDIYNKLTSIPSIQWPEDFKLKAAELTESRRMRYTTNAAVMNDVQISPPRRLISAVEAAAAANLPNEIFYAHRAMAELWNPQVPIPNHPGRIRRFSENIALAETCRSLPNRESYAIEAVKNASSPEEMFRATSLLLQDSPKPYILALAYVSARNDTTRKQRVERYCKNQNIIPAKDFIDEDYIKKITSVGQAGLVETRPPYRSGKSRGRGANRSSGQGYSQSPLGQELQESSSVRFEQMHGYEQSHLSGYTTDNYLSSHYSYE